MTGAESLRRDGEPRLRGVLEAGTKLLARSTRHAWSGSRSTTVPIPRRSDRGLRPDAGRWILTPVTTRVPRSITALRSPSGRSHRCLLSLRILDRAQLPDYPKYGVYGAAYIITTTREFGPTVEYGIGVYGLERAQMIKATRMRASSLLHRRERPRPAAARRRRAPPPDMDGPGTRGATSHPRRTQDDDSAMSTSDRSTSGAEREWGRQNPTATLVYKARCR